MGPGGQIGGEDEQVRPGQSADSPPPGPTPRWDESEDEQNGGRADDREEQTEPGLSSPRPRDEPGEERSHRQSRDARDAQPRNRWTWGAGWRRLGDRGWSG